MSEKAQRAKALFLEGYNCAQSTFLALSDLTGMDRQTALRLSSSFGGGMGRMREVCGAVTGMFMVVGILYGYDDAKDYEGKKDTYALVQELANQFKAETGSIICRELLGLDGKDNSPVPSKRTEEYYKKRTCGFHVEIQMEIRFKKCGISNQPDVCIFDDPCLSKFGTLRRRCSQPADNFRTFVCVPYWHQTTDGINATFMSNKT